MPNDQQLLPATPPTAASPPDWPTSAQPSKKGQTMSDTTPILHDGPFQVWIAKPPHPNAGDLYVRMGTMLFCRVCGEGTSSEAELLHRAKLITAGLNFMDHAQRAMHELGIKS